ncbi:MAG: hypothetical protein FWC40_09235 [Proteobacteria bacterium]|nr:hypothetical protein [Pseudomonadota bacterium]
MGKSWCVVLSLGISLALAACSEDDGVSATCWDAVCTCKGTGAICLDGNIVTCKNDEITSTQKCGENGCNKRTNMCN